MPEVIAENFKCPDESPGIWMELAGCDVQLHHHLLLEKGEGQAQLQPLEDGGVDEGEGHPIGGLIVRADGHPTRRNADADVEVIFSINGTRGLIRVATQEGF